jgi:hypothetical protein
MDQKSCRSSLSSVLFVVVVHAPDFFIIIMVKECVTVW